MSYVNNTKPSGSFTNNTKPSGSFTNDNRPATFLLRENNGYLLQESNFKLILSPIDTGSSYSFDVKPS